MDPRRDNRANNDGNRPPKRGRSDRPRSFPPSPHSRTNREQSTPLSRTNTQPEDARPGGAHSANSQADWENRRLPDDVSSHPAFQQPDSSALSPPSGYIPPGQNNQNSGVTNQHDYRSASSYSGDRQDNWGSDARFAPPSAHQSGRQQPEQYQPERYPQDRYSPERYQPERYQSDAHQPGQRQSERYDSDQYHPDQYQSGQSSSTHYGPPATSQTYGHAPARDPRGAALPQRYSDGAAAREPSHAAGVYPPRPGPANEPEPTQRSSVGRTILKILGWTFLLSMILIALVLGGGLLTLRNAATQFFNPGTQQALVTKAPVVASLKQVNKQIMIEHNNMVDIDYSEAPEGWLSVLPIEQSFVVLLRGRVPAGFDLSELTDDDVWISTDGSKIQLVLPPPVIFEDNVAVNFEESRVISEGDTCPNFICAQDLDAIQQVILPQGRRLLIETSEKSGIMEQAAELGIAYYESLLQSLGFEEIQVFIRSDVQIIQPTE